MPDRKTPFSGIAIIGVAGRFPGARDCDEFWQNLREGRGTPPRSSELAAAADSFDAPFSCSSDGDREELDPEQRAFLGVAWSALENASIDPDRATCSIAVFAGVGGDYHHKELLAARVAQQLNLRGDVVRAQTTCSNSLVAVCKACGSLSTFECDVALAGGVALDHFSDSAITGDSHHRPVDGQATETRFRNGVGAVVLKRLGDAVATGDSILAVIKGFAYAEPADTKTGLKGPSINEQARVVEMAWANAGIAPDSLSYLETHCAAASLGDSGEIAALTQAFGARADVSRHCAIGSVRSNVGDLGEALGIAALIKTVLALAHNEIPPTVNDTELTARLNLAGAPFAVTEELSEWQTRPGSPRQAGVSTHGIDGAIAHVVVEEAPGAVESGPSRSYQLILLSAHSADALETVTTNIARHLRAHPEQPVADVAHTLHRGRRAFTHRRAVVCRDRNEALAKLGGESSGKQPAAVAARHPPPALAFMFPGQGSQRVNMGRELYETESVYRDVVDKCALSLTTELGLDLREVLFPPVGMTTLAEEQIVQTRITQPALFVTEYAVAQLWMSWGIQPTAMIGHSVGEYVAACLSGVFSLEDGLRLIAERGRLVQQQPRGSMIAVMAKEEDVRPLLGENVSIAAVNAPTLCVASGPDDAIAVLEKALVSAKKMFRRLQTSHAFHSAMMDAVVGPFSDVLSKVRLSPPRIPFVSNLTATWVSDGEATSPLYWAQHLRRAVRFSDGIAGLLQIRDDVVFLEVGPGSTLTKLAREHRSKGALPVAVPSLSPGDQESDMAAMLGALGRLWQEGVVADWAGFYKSEFRRNLHLPGHPFERGATPAPKHH